MVDGFFQNSKRRSGSGSGVVGESTYPAAMARASEKSGVSFPTTIPPPVGARRMDRIALLARKKHGGLRRGAFRDLPRQEDFLGDKRRG